MVNKNATKNIKCQCPSCKTNISIDVDITKKTRKIPMCETPSCQQGEQGPRGPRGSQGVKGSKGPPGARGLIGPIGGTGVQGPTGLQGHDGPAGPDGPTGPTGPTGLGNRWYVGYDCSPTGTTEPPMDGDLLLDLNDCGICQYTETDGWINTGNNLNCLKCDDVYSCLKSLPFVDPNHGNCHVTLILNDLANIFNSGAVAITQIVIANQIQDISSITGMTFGTPQGLANILNLLEWDYNSAFMTNLYVLNVGISGSITGTNTYISFGNGDTYNMLLQCFCPPDDNCLPCDEFGSQSRVLTCKADQVIWIEAGCLGLTGPTGRQGTAGPTGLQGTTGLKGPTGPQGPAGIATCQEIYRVITDLVPEPAVTLCQFCGFFDRGCFTFLEMINQTFFIATAYDSPYNLVSALVPFSDDTEYQQALNTLNIVVIDNVVKVTQSPELINRIYYFNNAMNLIASISLVQTKCCPTGVDQNNQVLTKLPPTSDQNECRLAWVPAHCLVKPSIDLEHEIGLLPECLRYRCCVLLDITQPFLNNPGLYPFPWSITEMTVFGSDVTVDYMGDIYNYQDLGQILESNGWEPIFENSSIYRLCHSSNNPIIDTITNIKIIDNNSIVFYCKNTEEGGGLELDCTDTQELAPRDLQMIFKTNNGVSLGPASKIFDTFDICDEVTYNCLTLFTVDCFLTDLTVVGPWTFSEIIIGGVSQTVIPTSFSTSSELEDLLIDMGWTNDGNGVYSIFQNLSSPAAISTVTVLSSDDISTQTVPLNITCSANCGPTADLRLVLTRDDSNNYCWLSPECLRSGPTNLVTCCQGCTGDNCVLTGIPTCQIAPKFDLVLVLVNTMIDVINAHFSSTGPYWIVGYETDSGAKVSLNQPIAQPFSLNSLATAISNLTPPWTSNIPLIDIDNTTTQVRMSLLNSCDLIKKFSINLAGNDGLVPPFNYYLPINAIVGQDCPGLDSDAKVLIKDGANFCFVDVECMMPIVPPPIELSKELCDLDVCNEDLMYNICIHLNDCDAEKFVDTFGISQSLEIAQYLVVQSSPVDVNENIGANPSLADVINAFLNAGWTSPDATNRPVELNLVIGENINYVVINRVGANKNVAPYPYLIPASCTSDSNCPSTDPTNLTLIKTPDNKVCWTPICPIRGPQGNQGLVGMTGSQGDVGLQGFQGEKGDMGPTGGLGPRGFQGMTGVMGPRGAQGPTGNPGVGAPGEIGPIGPTGPPGSGQGPEGPQGMTGPMGDTGAIGPTGSIDDIDGMNIGGGAGEVFDDIIASVFRFRTLAAGANIDIATVGDQVDIGVSTNFDWSSTTFVGGNADVASGSSLTFLDGSELFVNNIEPTISATGVTIDTTAGPGVTIMDGGVKFQNNLMDDPDGATGVTSTIPGRQTFLEYFKFGTFDGTFAFPSGGSSDVLTLSYQRVGNSVTVFIPCLTPPFTNTSMMGQYCEFTGTVPGEIIPENETKFLFTYDLNGTYVDGTVSFLNSSPFIRIGKNKDDAPFAAMVDTINDSHNRAFTYVIIP